MKPDHHMGVVLVAVAVVGAWAAVAVQTPTPPAPAQVQGPCPSAADPVPDSWGAMFNMAVSTTVPSWFVVEQLGCPLESFIRIECYGRLVAGGLVRYFVDGTMPTALAGTVVPLVPPPPTYPAGPERTLDSPERFFLYTPALLRGFKVVAVGTATTIQWTCMRGI